MKKVPGSKFIKKINGWIAPFHKALNKIFKTNLVYDYKNISNLYKTTDRNNKKLFLGVFAGRSGMKWLVEIFCAHENVGGGIERNAMAEAFYRYIKWNKLPIDTLGIMELTKKEILKDWKNVDISVTGSPYFSHNLLNLFHELKADKVIWGINDPKFTVTSFYNKGVYSNENIRGDKNLINGFQPELKDEWTHFFGRLVPTGKFYDEWKSLTRIGKISWFLNTVNMEIYSSIKKIPKEKVWIFKLEEADQNYDYYLKLAKEFGLKPLLSEKNFLTLKGKKVIKGGEHLRVWSKRENIPKVWTQREEEEFQKYAEDYINIYKVMKNCKKK